MKYVFANRDHTIVRAEDGSTFELPRHTNPANINGHAAERWRAAGCPEPAPYELPRVPDDNARARRRSAGTERRPE
jgi:hypothetical protein